MSASAGVVLAATFLAFAAIVWLLDHRGFSGEMIWDSHAFIGQNAYHFLKGDPVAVITVAPGRILFMLTLYVTHAVAGMDPYAFRLINSVALAATGLSLVLFILAVLERNDVTPCEPRLHKWAVALLCGLLFVMHPLQLFAVLFIWQGQAIMACFFYYSALAVYVFARNNAFRPGVSPHVLTTLLFLAGLMTKENVLSLPAVLVLIELILFRQCWGEFAKRCAVIAAITAVAMTVYAVVNSAYTSPSTLDAHRGFIPRIEGFYTSSGLGLSEVFLTQCRVLFSYVRAVVAPDPSQLTLFRVQTISSSLWDPPTTLPACLGVVGLIVGALMLRERIPVIAFGALFFVVTLIPESLGVPHFAAFSYRAILPMAGILLVLSGLIAPGLQYVSTMPRKVVATALAVAAVMYLGCLTGGKASRWNKEQFWEDELAALPSYQTGVEWRAHSQVLVWSGKYFARTGNSSGAAKVEALAGTIEPRTAEHSTVLGELMWALGKRSEAVSRYRKAIDLDSDYPRAYHLLGLAMSAQGHLSEAVEYQCKAIEHYPESAYAHGALADLLWKQGNVSDAVRHYRKAIQISPNLSAAHLNLGALLFQYGRIREAKDVFQEAVLAAPHSAKAHANLGLALLKLKDPAGSVKHLRMAVALNPRLAMAHSHLGLAYEGLGDLTQAEKEYARAIEIDPGLVEAQYNMGKVMAGRDNKEAAEKHFRQALRVDPNHYPAHMRLGSILLSTGRQQEATEHFRKALEIRPGSVEAKDKLDQAESRSGAQ